MVKFTYYIRRLSHQKLNPLSQPYTTRQNPITKKASAHRLYSNYQNIKFIFPYMILILQIIFFKKKLVFRRLDGLASFSCYHLGFMEERHTAKSK